MTDVGKISLGVEIDADDLAARLGEAVRRAIAPALADIQRELNKTQREWEKTGRAAAKSGQAQAAAANVAQRAVHQLGDEHGKTATKANAATARQGQGQSGLRRILAMTQRAVHRVGEEHTQTGAKAAAASQLSARSINAVTRALERQTAALARNTAARAANAAAPTGGDPTGTGGGGPPPGGGGGGGARDPHMGGFMRGGRGRFGFLTSPVGLGGISLAAQALPAALTGVTNLVGAVQQLGQAGLALPGIYAGAAASIGTLVLGLKGVGEATSTLSEALKTGDPKDLEKAKEAMKDMAPAGVALAETMAKLNRGPLLEFRKNIQERTLAGFSGDLQALSDKALPRVSEGMGKIADGWNSTLKTLTGSLGQERNLGLIDRILGNTGDAQQRFSKAIDPIVHGLGTLVAGSSDALPRLIDGLTKGAERFDAWITKADADGRLQKWINEGIDGARNLGNAFLNIVKTITDLTRAAGGDGGFLKWLNDATARMRAFTSSAEGQSKLTEFFRGGREDMKQWGSLLSDLGPILLHVLDGFATWGEILLPIIAALAKVVGFLDRIPGLLQAIVVGFLAWRTLGPIIGGLTAKLGALSAAAATSGVGGGAAGAAGGANTKRGLAGQRGLAGASLIAAGSSTQITAGDSAIQQGLGALTTIGGTALTGAAIGSIIPGVGTAVGAVAGTAVGTALAGVNFLLGENSQKTKEAAAAAQEHAAIEARRAAAFDLSQAAMKSANDALIESKGAFDPASLGAVGEVIGQIPDKLAGSHSEDTIKAIGETMAGLNMTTEQLAGTVTGSAPQFDALIGRLNAAGEPGRILAEQLTSVRNEMLGISNDAAVAAPLLQTLADSGFGSVSNAAVAVQNALTGIPSDKSINMDMPQGAAVLDILTKVGVEARVDENKNIVVDAPMAQSVLDQLKALGYEVQHNNDKTITVRMDQQTYLDTMAKLGDLGTAYRQLFDQSFGLPAPPTPPAPNAGPFYIPGQPPRAGGGVLPGYTPRRDTMLVPMSGGEGVIIPEAMRALGPDWLYWLNSQFRSGLSRAGYQGGGVIHGAGGGRPPGPITAEDTTKLLEEIRDLLEGKGQNNPLAMTPDRLDQLSKQLERAEMPGTEIGPFGTPLKRKNRAYDAAKGALEALGFDAETIIGSDPIAAEEELWKQQQQDMQDRLKQYGSALTSVQKGMLPGAGGTTGSANWAALAQFESSGNPAINTGNGFSGAFQFTPETWRANKPPGAPDQAHLATWEQQVAAAENVLKSQGPQAWPAAFAQHPEWFQPQGGATTTGTTPQRLSALPGIGGGAGLNATGTSGLLPATQTLLQAVKQAFPQITEIGGVRQDAHPDHPSGRALDIMIPGGDTQGGANPAGKALGDQIWNWLMSTGIVDPQGSLWQTSTGGNHFNHIHARIAEGMENAAVQAGLIPGGTMPGMGAGGVTQVYVVNWPGQGGAGGASAPLQGILGGVTGGVNEAAGNVIGDLLGAVPGALATPEDQRMPDAELGKLIRERNPMALAAALGLNVQDFTREGGVGAENINRPDQKFDATGRLFSDTGALMDRTMTSLNAQLQAMREQLVDVITQVQSKLENEALEPVVKAGVQSALESLKDSVSTAIGQAMGNAAAPPIADAVKSAVSSLPIDQSGAGSTGNQMAAPFAGIAGNLFAGGGAVWGGIRGKDSVPILAQHGEFVLDTGDVARMGGPSGVEAFRQALEKRGGIRRMATGGGVIANDVVGAEFFGVSEVPIIGAIVNLLVRVLLKVIGVEIEARDTLLEMTDEFRSFRGDAFKAFDAQGRLLSDTSGLIERSATSEETAAAERIRILKIVIEALIKYIIEKVIVPITKAVANAVIQAGASAAGAAVSGAGGGPAGGIVSSVISSAGQAGVEIAAEVGTDFALAISSTLIDMVGEGLQSMLPDLMTQLFGGAALAGLFDPAGGMLATLFGGMFGAIAALFGGGLFGGASTMIPGIPFDNGGMAEGMGLFPKATMGDELILSPSETTLFSRFVSALERGGFGGGGNRTEVRAPITIVGGGRETAEQVQNRLLKLMP